MTFEKNKKLLKIMANFIEIYKEYKDLKIFFKTRHDKNGETVLIIYSQNRKEGKKIVKQIEHYVWNNKINNYENILRNKKVKNYKK